MLRPGGHGGPGRVRSAGVCGVSPVFTCLPACSPSQGHVWAPHCMLALACLPSVGVCVHRMPRTCRGGTDWGACLSVGRWLHMGTDLVTPQGRSVWRGRAGGPLEAGPRD